MVCVFGSGDLFFACCCSLTGLAGLILHRCAVYMLYKWVVYDITDV